jgi:PII-like signaling protein
VNLPEESVLLRMFLGESNRWKGQPLYEALVLRAREMHLAGATVLRGSLGFGATSRLHTAKVLRLSGDLPVVVEIVDSDEKVTAFLEACEGMIEDGLVTLERVRVLHYRARSGEAEG